MRKTIWDTGPWEVTALKKKLSSRAAGLKQGAPPSKSRKRGYPIANKYCKGKLKYNPTVIEGSEKGLNPAIISQSGVPFV